MLMRVLIGIASSLVLGISTHGAAEAQTPSPGSLRITVRDATDLPIAGATVTLTLANGSIIEATTGADGRATVENLQPGTYTGTIGAPGFTPASVPAFPVRSGGRVNRDVRLDIAGFVDQVEVLPPDADRQMADAFATELTPEEIAALPEDPEELLLVLQQLAGSDAEIRIDGFAGQLPPGVQIQDVRIRWDGGSAGSRSGGPRIEIRTRPGGDRWRSNAGASVRDERLNARNAFTTERPSGQTRQYSWSMNGPVVRNRTGLSLSIERSSSFEQQVVRAALPGGTLVSRLVDQPENSISFSARLEHALTDAQTLTVELRPGTSEATNQGIGELDLPERAYSRDGREGRLRVSHRTLERAFVNSFRAQLEWESSESVPVSQAPAIRVLDAYSSGGAQMQGGRRSRQLELENELEFTVRRRHQMTMGLSLNGTTHSGDEWRNAAGTFTFASLEMFEAGQPTSFTQRLGNPSFEYTMRQLGWHVQDDYRLRPNLMINLGLRHDLQSHLNDWANFSPRIGVNWTLGPNRRTSVRASFGVFHSPFGESLYEQTLLVDGERQRDLVISDPTYPDPYLGGVPQEARPAGIIRARPDIVMPSSRQFQIGVNQPIMPWARLRATYTRRTGHNLFRSRDANAPVNGVRPNPSVRTITELESTARSLNHTVDLDLSLSHQPKRLSASIGYQWRMARDETDGALTLPPDSFDLTGEWGRSRQDIPHRLTLSLNSDLLAGFRMNGTFRAQSGAPYTVTTGLDGNGDGISNERPAGIGRNSARGSYTKNLDLTLTWGLGVGQRAAAGGEQAEEGRGRGSRDNSVVRFELYARASNVLNFVNAQRYSGVMTSPFFGSPTSASAPRRLVVGSRISF